MALDPSKRVTRRRWRRVSKDGPHESRVPYLIGACGLIAMLALVYKLSVSGFNQFIAWQMQ